MPNDVNEENNFQENDQSEAYLFEEEIKIFLKKAGFKNVNGGRTFHIAPEGKKIK